MHELDQSGKISQINQVLMEFHHDPANNPENSLETILHILQSNEFVVEKAHITGRGLRNKKSLQPGKLQEVGSSKDKLFLTLSAVRKDRQKPPFYPRKSRLDAC